MTEPEARKASFVPLAGPYDDQTERQMLANVVADMRRGGINHLVIGPKHGQTVYRTSHGYRRGGEQ